MLENIKQNKNHWIAVAIGAAVGYFYAMQQEKKGIEAGGYALLGGVAACLMYSVLFNQETQKDDE